MTHHHLRLQLLHSFKRYAYDNDHRAVSYTHLGQSSFLPVKVAMSGVMPVIFAGAILSIPQFIQFFVNPKGGFWKSFFDAFSQTGWLYTLLYFLPVSYTHLDVYKRQVKSGDTVVILSGKDRGKKGKVMQVSPKEGQVIIENANFVQKHVKPRKMGLSLIHI